MVSGETLLAAAAGGWVEIRGHDPLQGDGRAWTAVTWPVSTFIAAWVLATLAVLAVWIRKLR